MNFNRDLLKLNEGHFQKAWYPRTRNEIFYIMVHIQSNFKFLPKIDLYHVVTPTAVSL